MDRVVLEEKAGTGKKSGANSRGGEKSGYLRRFLPIVVLALMAALVVSQGWHKYLTLEQLILNRDVLTEYVARHLGLALTVFMGIYVAIVALSLPGGALLTVAGGFLFGWVIGGISVVVAATLGAVILFLIARSSVGEFLATRAGPWLGKLSKGFQEDAFHYLLFLRLVPAFPFWLVNLAPALLGVNLRTFVIATFIGIIPGTFAFAFLGSGLDSVIKAQQEANQACMTGIDACEFKLDIGALVTPQLLIALGALGIVALLPIFLKKRRARKGLDR
ncbi:MAG: TVP38/TMEM64 family protein [Fimbriimonadaceae bacterium]|nr:TVP38/TMEM64 family protein [Alphaproteobacteria bacterium]